MYRFIFPAIILSLFMLQACDQRPAEVKAPVRPVKTVTVHARTEGKQWTFAGTAEDALKSALSFRVSGKITEFHGDQIGRRFSEGEVIARLDPSDYELQVRQAKANLEQVRANYVRAKADMARNEELFKRGVISRGELDQIEADFKSFDAQLNASAKQLSIARKHLGYTVLEAPFDGWIGSVEADIHQNVESGQPVVTFNAGRQMKMYIAVPDMLISRVHEGDEVDVHFDALPNKTMHGVVKEVSVDSDTSSSYPVKVYLDNKERLIRSGMSGHVSFRLQAAEHTAFYLPPVAVMGEANGTRSVWLVDKATSTVKKQPVKVDQLSSRGLEVVEGLKTGDVVVIRGVSRLKEGLKVRFMQNGAEG